MAQGQDAWLVFTRWNSRWVSLFNFLLLFIIMFGNLFYFVVFFASDTSLSPQGRFNKR